MARKDFGAKPYTYPQPVFILATYNEDGTANAMNAAWGGISEDNKEFPENRGIYRKHGRCKACGSL